MMVSVARQNIPEVDRRSPDSGSVFGRLARQTRAWTSPMNGRHHRPVASWYELVGRVLQSWPLTLRIAILILVVLTGTAELAAKIGLSGQVLAILLNIWYWTRRRTCGGIEFGGAASAGS